MRRVCTAQSRHSASLSELARTSGAKEQTWLILLSKGKRWAELGMSIREGLRQSKNDHDFILRSMRRGRRVDGRQLGDMRLLRMVFSRAEGQSSAEVQLGRTRVLAVVTGEVVPPFPDRPTEGFLHFNIELGPMAAANFGERNSPLSVEIARIIEISVRDSQALDTEALCIIGGEKVWQLRCDVHVLDHGGNLIDASALATMAALRHFRRPEVTVDGSRVVVHHTDEKEPHPLALHHVPICITFALFEAPGEDVHSHGGGARRGVSGMTPGVGGVSSSAANQFTAVDPTEAEEEVLKGRVTFALTAHKELCALHKNGGVAVTREAILECAEVAARKVQEIHGILDKALAEAEAKAALERQRRLRGTASGQTGSDTRARKALGQGPGVLPGTRSTPFVVAQKAMPVAPESLEVKHLDYDDLHVTQSIREEGLRGGGNRGGRGLDMYDARNTDLFAKMAKAASVTETRIAQEEQKHAQRRKGAEEGAPPTKAETSLRHQKSAGGLRSEPSTGEDAGSRSSDQKSQEISERRKEDTTKYMNNMAQSEFARVARSLQADGPREAGDVSKTAMDVDSDEGEVVTFQGEFKLAEKQGLQEVESEGRFEGRAADDADDEDLLTAVKKGRGRRTRAKDKSKGRRA